MSSFTTGNELLIAISVGRTYITEFCWVMSQTGAENSWLPFDLGQEENICDIKVCHIPLTSNMF
jgi:hypothetical protein